MEREQGEFLRPQLDTNLSYEERMEAINRYLGETALAVATSSTEYNWAICQRILIREQQRESYNG
jgi:hypothetical protein